jgi:predicted nucleic acid-binding Zn finger protein
MNEKQMKIIDTIAARWAARLAEEEKARLQRAVEALKGGAISFLRAGDEIRVINGEGRSYTIRRSEDRWQCSCPDFMNRGKANGWRCKHLLAYFLAERAGLVQPASPNGHEPSEPEEASGAQPQPQPQPAQAEPQAAPTGEGLDPVVPFGRHRGKRLSEAAREDPEYLFFLARRMEPRSDEDRVLQEAALDRLRDLVAEAVERAFADPAAMPVLPFGEEKGKPLDKAHPKWAAILAKKGPEDARSFQDLVLYEVARRLQQRRLQERRKKASSLDAEVLIGAVSVAVRQAVREAVLEALEAARQAAADSEAITADLADLRRRVERLERLVAALRPLAEREAALAAR